MIEAFGQVGWHLPPIFVWYPIWGPISKDAPPVPITNGPAPHGSILALKVALGKDDKKPFLKLTWALAISTSSRDRQRCGFCPLHGRECRTNCGPHKEYTRGRIICI